MSEKQWINPPPPGIYLDVPAEEYHAWRAINQSSLNKLTDSTPRRARYEVDNPGEPTKALFEGTLLHLAVLEPSVFDETVAVLPPDEEFSAGPYSKKGKEERAAWRAEQGDKLIATEEQHERALAMSTSVYRHSGAREFLMDEGANEVSLVWRDTDLELDLPAATVCKTRIDRVSRVGTELVVGDLKSTLNASRPRFEQSIHKFGYHIQAAHIFSGLEELGLENVVRACGLEPSGGFSGEDRAALQPRFMILAVEKAPPYCAAFYELVDEALEEGLHERNDRLQRWARCEERRHWPGYPAHELIGLPPYAYRKRREAPEQ